MKNYIIARLQEPSTWRGLIKLASAFGVFYFSTDQADAIVAMALALSGAGGLLPDSLQRLPR